MGSVIDERGYRANVGIILCNGFDEVLLARRIGQPDGWQFPQGGMAEGESPVDAMYRELHEETGLQPAHVRILAETRDWLFYDLPDRYVRPDRLPLCIGQKQKWFLLRLVGDEQHIDLEANPEPEFDHYEWVDYWYPVDKVIAFKRAVYRKALHELQPALSNR